MKSQHQTLLFLIFIVAISLFSSLCYYKKLTLLTMTNTLFLLSLLSLMAGGLLYVLETGFFNGMIYSFKRFYRQVSKMEQLVEDRHPDAPTHFKFAITSPLLLAGSILFLVSLVAGHMLV